MSRSARSRRPLPSFFNLGWASPARQIFSGPPCADCELGRLDAKQAARPEISGVGMLPGVRLSAQFDTNLLLEQARHGV